MPQLTLTSKCVARTGHTDDFVVVPAAELANRLGWLQGLCDPITAQYVAACWNRESMDILAAGVDGDGNPLPRKGFAAGRRLGWNTKRGVPAGVYVSDRVQRAGEEHAMRLLRGALSRRAVTAAIVEVWPVDWSKRTKAEWDSLHPAITAAGAEFSLADVRNRTRSVAAFVKKNGRLPADITEAEEPPTVAAVVMLAAADKQLVSVSRDGDEHALLRLQLPSSAAPVSRRDWDWVTIRLRLGGHVRADAVLKTPALRCLADVNGETVLRADMPFVVNVPAAALTGKSRKTGKLNPGHVRATAMDWGVNCAASVINGTIDDNRSEHPVIRTDGKPYFFSASGMTAKTHRLRRHTEVLTPKIAQIEKLLAGLPEGSMTNETLPGRLAILTRERDAVSRRRSNLGTCIAQAIGNWVVNIAVNYGSTAIFVENLADHEASGCGRKQNTRISNQVKAQIVHAIRHIAARHGIAVIVVPTRGTSKFCSRCLHRLAHVKSPDRPKDAGHCWGVCGGCGRSADRDHGSAERILSRGLAGQHSAFLDNQKHWRITKVVDVPVIGPDPVETKKTADAAGIEKARLARSRNDRRNAKRRKAAAAETATSHQLPAQRRKKTASTPPRLRARKAVYVPSEKGRVRLTGPAPATRASAPVQRPAGTVTRPPHHHARRGGHHGTTKPQRVRQQRRTQGRGFHPLCHPTWVSQPLEAPPIASLRV